MKSLSRIEELASRYLLGNLEAAELSEFEGLLAESREARDLFAQICVDEVLLRDALGAEPPAGIEAEIGELSAERSLSPAAHHAPSSLALRAREREPKRLALPAAAAVLAFLGGWTLSPRIPPHPSPENFQRDLSEAALLGEPSAPLPIYFPQEPLQEARLVVYPLDFDESGALTANPFVQYEPSHNTEL